MSWPISGFLAILAATFISGMFVALMWLQPEPVDTAGDCLAGFVGAVDFIHENLPDGLYVTDGQGATPLKTWFPAYEDMGDVVDAAALEVCSS